jgi:hypothetical protein
MLRGVVKGFSRKRRVLQAGVKSRQVGKSPTDEDFSNFKALMRVDPLVVSEPEATLSSSLKRRSPEALGPVFFLDT